MYIFFNRQGVLTTQIPHGEIVRQSGSLTFRFAFEDDYIFDLNNNSSNYTLTIAFKRPGDKEFGTTYVVPTSPVPKEEVFTKVKPSEMTYSFVDGKKYRFCDFLGADYDYITERPGEVQAVVRLLDKSNTPTDGFSPNVNVSKVLAQGLVRFNVERTYGTPYKADLTLTQFDALISYIDSQIGGIAGTYIKNIVYDETKYTFEITKQDNTIIYVDLPIETQQIDIQQNKENIATLQQQINTAVNNIILDNDTYKITATKVDGSALNLDLSQITTNKRDVGTLQNDMGSVKTVQVAHSTDISELKTKALQINTNMEDITVLQTNDIRQDNRLLAIEQDVANINGNNVVKTLKQTLTETQKQQARENIGVDVSQFILKTEKGARSGVATLDENGFLTASQIPSHLDEIVSGTLVNNTTFRDRKNVIVTPKEYCIYFDTTTKKRYGWSGTEFVELTSGGLVLGTTEGTAFDGGKGATLESKVTTLENAVKPIPNKVDKISGTNQVYTTNGGITYSTTPANDSIVRRTSDGRIKASRPTEDNDVITKAYMQEFGGKIDPVDLEKIIEGQNHITTELSSDKTKVIIKNDNTIVVNTDIASNDKLGLVKVGDDFDIAQDGTISLYKPIKILSFTNNIGSVAKGQVINQIIFNWQTSKLPNKIELENQTITPNTTTTKTLENQALRFTKTYTLKTTDARGAITTATTTVNFNNYVLYGSGSTFNENALKRVLKTTRAGVYEVDALVSEHIYFSIPASLGLPAFFVGGFEGGFVLEKTYNWDNGFGYTESYNVYKSVQTGLGKTQVEVK